MKEGGYRRGEIVTLGMGIGLSASQRKSDWEAGERIYKRLREMVKDKDITVITAKEDGSVGPLTPFIMPDMEKTDNGTLIIQQPKTRNPGKVGIFKLEVDYNKTLERLEEMKDGEGPKLSD